jgi:hypothetical protein
VPYVSPINPHEILLTGRYLRCPSCSAPWSEPIPPHWLLTVKGEVTDARITPHLPNCLALERGGDR